MSELFNSRLFASAGCRIDAGTISQLVGFNGALSNKNSNASVTTTTSESTATTITNNNNNSHSNNNNTLSLFSLSSLNSNTQDCADEYVDVDGTTDLKEESPTPTTEQILRLMITGSLLRTKYTPLLEMDLTQITSACKPFGYVFRRVEGEERPDHHED
ncbi:hypothetical protein COOONC_09973 [Cooperia oncophora]